MTAIEAIARLKDGYYNSQPLDGGTNPGGLAAGGHVANFPAALEDIGLAAEKTGTDAAAVAADRAATEGFKTDAETAAGTATTKAGEASADAAAVAADRVAVEGFKTDAEAAATTATTKAGEASADAATVAADRAATEAARDTTLGYRDATEGFKNGAEAAAADARGYRGFSVDFIGLPSADEVLGGGSAPYAMVLSAANSFLTAGVAATAEAVLPVMRRAFISGAVTQIGTATFAAAGNIAVVAYSDPNVAHKDRVYVLMADPADATLADISGFLME